VRPIDRMRDLVSTQPGITTGRLSDALRATHMTVKRWGLELQLGRKIGPVPGHRGVTTRWYPADQDPEDAADAAAQLDAIDDWLNARGVPEVGTTLERVTFALGRCWEAG
jgi:hypothetical protein